MCGYFFGIDRRRLPPGNSCQPVGRSQVLEYISGLLMKQQVSLIRDETTLREAREGLVQEAPGEPEWRVVNQ